MENDFDEEITSKQVVGKKRDEEKKQDEMSVYGYDAHND